MADKGTYKSMASLVMGAVSASLVLFPSLLSVVAKPLVGSWLMWAYLGCGLIALAGLSYTYYYVAFASDAPLPIISSSFGAFFGGLSIFFFAIFLFLNLLADQCAAPTISSIVASRYDAAPGEVVTISAKGEDQNGDRLKWTWQVEQIGTGGGHTNHIGLSSKLDAAVWSISAAALPGIYRVSATASDGERNSQTEAVEIIVRKTL